MSNVDELREMYICNVEEPDESWEKMDVDISAEIPTWSRTPCSPLSLIDYTGAVNQKRFINKPRN